jgi:hypothetical protein
MCKTESLGKTDEELNEILAGELKGLGIILESEE